MHLTDTGTLRGGPSSAVSSGDSIVDRNRRIGIQLIGIPVISPVQSLHQCYCQAQDGEEPDNDCNDACHFPPMPPSPRARNGTNQSASPYGFIANRRPQVVRWVGGDASLVDPSPTTGPVFESSGA